MEVKLPAPLVTRGLELGNVAFWSQLAPQCSTAVLNHPSPTADLPVARV